MIEQAIKDALGVIRETYVDAELGEKVARAIEEYMGTETGINRMQLEDPGIFLWEINSIVASITHDIHFGFSRRQQSSSSGDSGIYRYSPHYIKLYRFDTFGQEHVRRKITEFFAQVQDPLIVDVRNCSGGDLECLHFFLCHFFPDNTALYEEHTRMNPPRLYKAVSHVDTFDTFNDVRKYTGRVKVLVNSYSYSAAEVFAHIMQSHGRAKIYGTQTAGAGYGTYDIPFGDITLHIPFCKPVDAINKNNHEGIGVKPDYGPATSEFISTIFSDVYMET